MQLTHTHTLEGDNIYQFMLKKPSPFSTIREQVTSVLNRASLLQRREDEDEDEDPTMQGTTASTLVLFLQKKKKISKLFGVISDSIHLNQLCYVNKHFDSSTIIN